MSLRREIEIGADDASKWWLHIILCIVGLSVFATQCAPALGRTSTCEGVQILSEQLTVTEAEEYCRYAVHERKKVEGYWGDTWNETIRINVSSSYRISRSLVPGYFGKRGFMEMPLRGVRDNTGPLLHEIVHIYAPNNNRFLAEGFAVYLHTKLGGGSSLSQLWRGLAPFSCPLTVGGKIFSDVEQCADARPVEQCNGRTDCLCFSGFVRRVLNRAVWLAAVPQPVRDGELREGLREVCRYA